MKKAKKKKLYSITQVAKKFGVTRQGVAYQVDWRKLGIKDKGRIYLTAEEVKQLGFRRPNKEQEVIQKPLKFKFIPLTK